MCYSHILFDPAIKAGRGLLQAGLAVSVFRLVQQAGPQELSTLSALITSRPTPPQL